jgi:uncharacterized protein
MTLEHKEAFIRYRLQRAKGSLGDAILLCDNKRWNAAVNRLYYACFYMATALLLENGVQVKSHDGVRIQFGLMFVKTGVIDKKFGKLYSRLFNSRQKGDYGDMYNFEAEMVLSLMSSVDEFVNEVGKHLRTK